MGRHAIITVSNDVATDQRVIRMSELLADSGWSTTIIGRQRRDSAPAEGIKAEVRRFRMVFSSGFLFYKFLNIRLLFFLLRRKPDLLIAVDLDTLLPGVIVSKLRSVPLLYDAHEYFTGVPELADRPLVRWVWKVIERFCFRHVRSMVTVNESIAEIYRNEYGIEPVIVRNIGKRPGPEVSQKRDLGIGVDDMIVLIQGTGINSERGGLEAIMAIEKINMIIADNLPDRDPRNVHLLIIGSGNEVPGMRDYVFANGLVDNVTFLAPMPWADMMTYTRMADIGLSLDKASSINYICSLPNKIFDFLNAGIAVIATRLPEIEKIIATKECGILIDDNRTDLIADAILRLYNDDSLLKRFKANAAIASFDYSWDNEKKILLSAIEESALNKTG